MTANRNDSRYDILISREDVDDTRMWYYYRGLPELQWNFRWWNSSTVYLYLRYKGINPNASVECDYISEFYVDDDDIKSAIENALYTAVERTRKGTNEALTAADCILLDDLSPSSRQFYSELFPPDNCTTLVRRNNK